MRSLTLLILMAGCVGYDPSHDRVSRNLATAAKYIEKLDEEGRLYMTECISYGASISLCIEGYNNMKIKKPCDNDDTITDTAIGTALGVGAANLLTK